MARMVRRVTKEIEAPEDLKGKEDFRDQGEEQV